MSLFRAFLLVFLPGLLLPSYLGAGEKKTDLDSLLARLPAKERAEGDAVCKALLEGGPAVVGQLVARLSKKEDAPARYALHGLALYTSRPGASKERAAYSASLAKQLAGDQPAPVKAFLLQQLQFVGGPEAVPAVARLLSEEAVASAAAQTLTRIGGEPARKALHAALAEGKTKALPEVMLALGKMRDRDALPFLKRAQPLPTALSELRPWLPWGNSAIPAAMEPLAAAVGPKPSYDRAQAVDACLVLATRLAEAGQTAQAVKFLDRLLTTVKDPRGRARSNGSAQP